MDKEKNLENERLNDKPQATEKRLTEEELDNISGGIADLEKYKVDAGQSGHG